jgi:hypothetical protein
MIGILCIGVVTALAVIAIVAKTFTGKPTKAQKWEKADIMKQLLALSEGENGTAAIKPAQSPTPHTSVGTQVAKLPRKARRRASRQVHSNPARPNQVGSNQVGSNQGRC